jgi:hypothetical protein
MAKFQPITEADMIIAIEQLAEGDARIVTLAKALRIVLGEIRQEFYDYGTEQSLPRDQVDAVFDAILTSMLGPHSRVH